MINECQSNELCKHQMNKYYLLFLFPVLIFFNRTKQNPAKQKVTSAVRIKKSKFSMI
jgi:hypothetical protein